MACRIGITTDPEKRKLYWEGQHPTLRNWEILEWHNTKSAAQKAETRLAKQYNCTAHPGGDGPENDRWAVYKFDH